jgi:hypothetical protein
MLEAELHLLHEAGYVIHCVRDSRPEERFNFLPSCDCQKYELCLKYSLVTM